MVDARELTFSVLEVDTVRKALHERIEQVALVGQSILRLLALGGITGDHATHVLPTEGNNCYADFYVQQPAVLASVLPLAERLAPALHNAPNVAVNSFG